MNTCDKVYHAVIAAIDDVCTPKDQSADVMEGLMEALCFLCITLLDPSKSEEEGRTGLLFCVGSTYDMVLAATKMRKM